MDFFYIGENIQQTHAGGDVVNKQNIQILKSILKKNFKLINVAFTSPIVTLINSLFGYLYGLSPISTRKIIKKITEGTQSPVIFLPSSKMGKLCYKIKKAIPNSTILVFFHNIEKHYTQEELKNNRNFKNKYFSYIINKNELLSCKYGDYIIVLNERDNNLLYKYYKRNADLIAPITLTDKFNIIQKSYIKTSSYNQQLTILFVGSAFFANIEGIKWFIDNVFSQIKGCKLQIVGNNMDYYFQPSDNIEVYGYVEDLSIFYYQCDFIISPILSGGGMKTKTAEALMYGCPIIGTREAFEGYNIDYSSVGYCCNNANEMIKAIENIINNPLILNKFSQNSRQIYENLYSTKAGENRYRELLNKCL